MYVYNGRWVRNILLLLYNEMRMKYLVNTVVVTEVGMEALIGPNRGLDRRLDHPDWVPFCSHAYEVVVVAVLFDNYLELPFRLVAFDFHRVVVVVVVHDHLVYPVVVMDVMVAVLLPPPMDLIAANYYYLVVVVVEPLLHRRQLDWPTFVANDYSMVVVASEGSAGL